MLPLWAAHCLNNHLSCGTLIYIVRDEDGTVHHLAPRMASFQSEL
jgi:hypothetical protein